MRRALQLARRGGALVRPNPMVGAVLVHQGRIISEGYHHQYGQAHAEADCLNRLPAALRRLLPQSTMYVTLEPCAHYGKTPPCALRLVQEGVGAVVIAHPDPFAGVNGRGIQILEEAGIRVSSGLLQPEAAWLNRRFFTFHTRMRPYIVLKWAQSAQGFMAPPGLSRLQLSNAHSRQLTHRWRTSEAAILVGYRTALADDPQLTARYWAGPQPLRIVLDRGLNLPRSLKIFDDQAHTWVVNEQREGQEGHIRYLRLPFDRLLQQNLLAALHQARILSLIVEGGAATLEGFISKGLWDEARVFTAAASLTDGLHAPALPGACLAARFALEDDTLQLLQPAHTPYPYTAGMDF
jgi:diaminohydroxyphosphoribosylaminopyrimidine deaminase/5-amino-6-(5-phosphoribosylamino)uracil reductase